MRARDLVATIVVLVAIAVITIALSCGGRPLEHGCNPGLDGGAAYCESTHAAAPSCAECPP